MPLKWRWVCRLAELAAVLASCAFLSNPVQSSQSPASEYRLGPEDQLRVRAPGLEEIGAYPVRVNNAGEIDLPVVGRVRAAGCTLTQLREQLRGELARWLKDPEVSVEIVEFGSHPVTVLGAVNKPGVYQLQSGRTLAEMLSLAGGPTREAGSVLRISRRADQQPLPLPGTQRNDDGTFQVASVDLDALLKGQSPDSNITLQPHDILTLPEAELVYVLGAVRKPGGFTLRQGESMSVLQALSLAEGLGPANAAGRSRILRRQGPQGSMAEIPVDLNRLIAGKTPDVAMRSQDILIVPSSTGKQVAMRAADTALQVVSGVIIWRR
jgi:polysaccharide export outer membrane protein